MKKQASLVTTTWEWVHRPKGANGAIRLRVRTDSEFAGNARVIRNLVMDTVREMWRIRFSNPFPGGRLTRINNALAL